MKPRKNDEINNITFEEYFQNAPLDDNEKGKRISLAEELEILFLYLQTAHGVRLSVDH